MNVCDLGLPDTLIQDLHRVPPQNKPLQSPSVSPTYSSLMPVFPPHHTSRKPKRHAKPGAFLSSECSISHAYIEAFGSIRVFPFHGAPFVSGASDFYFPYAWLTAHATSSNQSINVTKLT
jgi:hypothetical protein